MIFVDQKCSAMKKTRIQQATSLFPGRGGHVPSDLLSALASRKQNTLATRTPSARFCVPSLATQGSQGAAPPVKRLASLEAGVFQA